MHCRLRLRRHPVGGVHRRPENVVLLLHDGTVVTTVNLPVPQNVIARAAVPSHLSFPLEKSHILLGPVVWCTVNIRQRIILVASQSYLIGEATSLIGEAVDKGLQTEACHNCPF